MRVPRLRTTAWRKLPEMIVFWNQACFWSGVPLQQEGSNWKEYIQTSSRSCQERGLRALTSHPHVLSNMRMKKFSVCWVDVARYVEQISLEVSCIRCIASFNIMDFVERMFVTLQWSLICFSTDSSNIGSPAVHCTTWISKQMEKAGHGSDLFCERQRETILLPSNVQSCGKVIRSILFHNRHARRLWFMFDNIVYITF